MILIKYLVIPPYATDVPLTNQRLHVAQAYHKHFVVNPKNVILHIIKDNG